MRQFEALFEVELWELRAEIILPLSNPSVAHDGIDVINVNPGFINPYNDY